MTKVKICGLKETQHVKAAVENGADFIGFVFAPSKRQVTVELAQQLAQDIPEHVLKVGVFVNENSRTIKQIAEAVPLDIIQLHGQEDPAITDELHAYKIIKAISVKTKEDLKTAAKYDADYYLFDAPGTDFEGGSGHTFDWSLLENNGISRKQTFLAGGLNSVNIEGAIEQVQPFAVDISSGVETDGVKDSQKIEQFIKKAKSGVEQV